MLYSIDPSFIVINKFKSKCVLGLIVLTAITTEFCTRPVYAEPKEAMSWSICLHAVDVSYDLEQTKQAFQRIKALGANQVRTDFDWSYLEPTRGELNPAAVEYFEGFVNEAQKAGLEVITILFHQPEWANQLYKNGSLEEFLTAYGNYAYQIAKLYGDRIQYYQYWNESNIRGDMLKFEDRWRVFLAADQGVRRAQPARTPVGIVNFTIDNFYRYTWNWRGRLKKTFSKINQADPNHTIRTIGIDLYPGTWSLPASLGGWNAIDDVINIITDSEHPCYQFDVAVTETGYSQYFGSPWNQYIGRGESAQAEWFNKQLPFLYKKFQAFNAEHDFGFRWIGIYELYDGDEKTKNPEGHFGIYHEDRTPKAAVKKIKSIFMTLSQSQAGEVLRTSHMKK